MKMSKLLFLLLTIVLFDNNVLYIKNHVFAQAYANVSTSDSKAFVGDEYLANDKATHPNCGISNVVSKAVLISFTASVASLVFAIVLSATMPAMSWLIAASTATLALTVTQNMIFFACKYSFVRHPVLRFKDGRYKTCTNPKKIKLSDQENSESIEMCIDHHFSVSDKYEWPKNKSPYSDHIEFCNRSVLGGACIGSDCKSKLDPRERETSLDVLDSKSRVGGNLTCKTLKEGESVTISGILFKASYKGDKLCVDALGIGNVSWWPQPEIGCHLREPMPPSPMCSKSVAISDNYGKIIMYDNSKCFSCYISSSCYSESGIFSHAPLAMTSVVVQCLKESLTRILHGCEDSKITNTSFLDTVKNYLQNTVKALIVLALMLFGMKLMLGAVKNMSEVGLLLIKVCLVFYFSIGDGSSLYYKKLISISNGLSDIVFQAGGNSTICNYKSTDYHYPVVISNKNLDDVEKKIYREIIHTNVYHNFDSIRANKNNFLTASNITDLQFDSFLSKLELRDYSYLALWDRLDCRIMFYLGQSINQGVGFSVLSLLIMPLAFLFVGQILLTIIILLTVIMLLIMCLWIVHLFIISLIALTIIFLFAPLFVPMCLFQVTKNFFEGWLKELMAYSLYPIVLFASIGIIFSVFDTLYFGDLTFKTVKSMNYNSIRSIYTFTLDPENQCDSRTDNLACIVTKSNFITKPLIFGINVTAINVWGDTAQIWKGFGMIAIMAFLFYHFLIIISSFAAELVGSFRADFSRAVMSPGEIGQKAIVGAISLSKNVKNYISSKNKSDGENKKNKKPREGISGKH